MPTDFSLDPQEEDDGPSVPLGGTRAEAIHRLQVGLLGLGAIVLMVGLANVVMERAKESEASTVPQSSATFAAQGTAAPNKDPLADAGVVPDLPAQTPRPAVSAAGSRGDRGGSAAQP